MGFAWHMLFFFLKRRAIDSSLEAKVVHMHSRAIQQITPLNKSKYTSIRKKKYCLMFWREEGRGVKKKKKKAVKF